MCKPINEGKCQGLFAYAVYVESVRGKYGSRNKNT